jgi:DHA1 family bicyclomycin/chloramphenicol resistance-like MFS transporter
MSKHHFVFLMAAIMAAGPFAVDAYLPAIPGMATYLGVGAESVASTISFYIFGMAIGQIIGGPLADRFEKRNLISIGLLIFASSCLVIAASSNIEIIKVMRVFQAVGAGFAIVCVAPLVRQREKGNAAAKLFGLIGLIFIIAPAIAPSIGALILLVGSWQTIFYFMAGYALFVLILVQTSLPKAAHKPAASGISPIQRYVAVAKNSVAMRYLLVQSMGYSVMMVFVTNSSFIYQGHFGLDKQIFGLVFAANTVFNIIANRINSRFLNTTPAHKLLRIGLMIQAMFVLLLVVFTYLEVPVYIYAIGIIGAAGALGAIQPNTNALFISQYKEHTGSASALLGSAQFTAAAALGGITTWLFNNTLWPIVIVMAVLVISTNLLLPKVDEEME